MQVAATDPRPDPSGSGVILSLDGVVKSWGAKVVLTGATARVGHGITGLLGANGTGKTTLIGMILGLHPPDAGRIIVLGHDSVTAGPEVRTHLGYSPEHHLLPPDVKAVDLVRHVAELHGVPSRAARSRASDALWLVGLGEERGRAVGTMSTGQRQRVKLAQCLAHDPALIILDEPTDGLDPLQRDAMLDLISKVSREFGISVLLSSHNLDEVERLCDSVVILHQGQVAAAGRLADLQVSADQGIVAVEFDDTAERIALVLDEVHRAGVESRVVDRVHLFRGRPDLTAVLTRAVARHEVGLRSLGPHPVSLEEVFLGVGSPGGSAATGRPAPAPPPPPPPPAGGGS
ncbi:MAG: ABC transporter ATP-binding protein [Actinobacteria bacterium]|nr:ABC transporter ATP-binding protein [Actinomycetota bacterium]